MKNEIGRDRVQAQAPPVRRPEPPVHPQFQAGRTPQELVEPAQSPEAVALALDRLAGPAGVDRLHRDLAPVGQQADRPAAARVTVRAELVMGLDQPAVARAVGQVEAPVAVVPGVAVLGEAAEVAAASLCNTSATRK